MDYYQVSIYHHLTEDAVDLCIDDLGGIGFESFEEKADVIIAYISKENYQIEALNLCLSSYGGVDKCETVLVPDQDWNAVWEANYKGVRFDNFCFIHAPSHNLLPEVKHNIEIEPKMSFGTAHHPTTALMIRFLEKDTVRGKEVLDMGCGTGILAILAYKEGASKVVAIDNDNWAYKNSVENARRNQALPIEIIQADAAVLKNRHFDVIIANINRNILLRDICIYADCLPVSGNLYLSGFYERDVEKIEEECNAHKLFCVSHENLDEWVALKFVKK
ncbi:MAG: 50S ribosomal protein L11 methyltransferase [Bacteroidales bacterium]